LDIGAQARHVGVAVRAFLAVLGNPGLRGLQLAWGGWVTVDWAYTVAISVFAFSRNGAAGVGLVTLIRLLPAAATAPFTAGLGDRFPRRLLLAGEELIIGLILAMTAIVTIVRGPDLLVYALAVALAIVSAPFRALQGALLPTLAQTPDELTASNLVGSTVEAAATLIGPALAGVLLGLASATAVFWVTAVISLAAAVSVLGIPRAAAVRWRGRRRKFLEEIVAGFTTLARERDVRLLVSLFVAQPFVRGALNVLIVVLAIDGLRLGNPGVGWLFAALGVGGLVGAIVAVRLVGQRRMASWFAVGLTLWGLPLLILALQPPLPVALALLATVGVGNLIEDVAGFSILQRIAPDRTMARILGVFEALIRVTAGLGAVVTGFLVVAVGPRPSFLLAGALLPVLVAIAWRHLRRLDSVGVIPAERLALLRQSPLFAPLSVIALERVARRLQAEEVAAGTDVMREGDQGDRFYLIEAGELEVVHGTTRVRRLTAGDHFGEIALLRGSARSATVRALAPSRLLRLESGDFLAAVTQHSTSSDRLESVVAARLDASAEIKKGQSQDCP
jgi:MFS family permease